MLMKRNGLAPTVFLATALCLICTATFGQSQQDATQHRIANSANQTQRIVSAVNESDLVQLRGHTHPLAVPEFDEGGVADDLRMGHMFVVLRRSPQQEQALEHLAAQLHNPHSAN